MAGAKWEELNMDCLVNVFGRVGMESLLVGVPFICKSWYRASLDPSCWECLIFPNYEPWFYDFFMEEYRIDEGSFSVTSFIKFIINRSHGNATTVVLPSRFTKESLKYVADKCPALKMLGLPSDSSFDYSSTLAKLIGKWKNLEVLKIGGPIYLDDLMPKISLHCKNFSELDIFAACLWTEKASAIVNFLPNLKSLVLRESTICQEDLQIIQEGCKFVNVRDCVGFDEGVDRMLRLASLCHDYEFTDTSCSFDDDYVFYYDGYYDDYDFSES